MYECTYISIHLYEKNAAPRDLIVCCRAPIYKKIFTYVYEPHHATHRGAQD